MAEENILRPATLTSSDGSASEDSWTFLDEFDDLHAVDNNSESVSSSAVNHELENLTETPIENAVEAVALDGKTAPDAVTDRNTNSTTKVEPQRYEQFKNIKLRFDPMFVYLHILHSIIHSYND